MISLASIRKAILATGLVAASSIAAMTQGRPAPQLEIPAPEPRQVTCAFEAQGEIENSEIENGEIQNPGPVFELMKTGPAQAVACAKLLDERLPGWHSADGADALVAPFVSYLLGDGTARGLQRHGIFIDLLGHLERIAPDWRLRPSVEALLSEIILGSVVEDPFVANFWASALPEIDQEWPESEAAEAVVPELYRLAISEEREATGVLNPRPRTVLKEVSWMSYARLQLATRVFNTWAKRATAIAVMALILVLATRAIRRRSRGQSRL